MNEHQETTILRLLVALGDFQMALSAATFLAECEPHVKYSMVDLRRFRCFETTLIVAYSRPFKADSKRFKWSVEDLGLNLSEHELELHQEILNRRDKIYAHTDQEMVSLQSDAIAVFEDKPGIMLPVVSFDEGLFYIGSRNYMVQEMLHGITSVLGTRVFDIAQENPKALKIRKMRYM